MVFSSMVFLFAFLPAVLVLYFIAPKKLKNTVLFVTSLFFYAWGEPKYILLMLASITAAYVTGIFADKQKYGKSKAFAATLARIICCSSLSAFFILLPEKICFSSNIHLSTV